MNKMKVLVIGEEEDLSQMTDLVFKAVEKLGLQQEVIIHRTTTEEVASMVFRNIYQKVIQVRRGSDLQVPSNFLKGGQKCWVL